MFRVTIGLWYHAYLFLYHMGGSKGAKVEIWSHKLTTMARLVQHVMTEWTTNVHQNLFGRLTTYHSIASSFLASSVHFSKLPPTLAPKTKQCYDSLNWRIHHIILGSGERGGWEMTATYHWQNCKVFQWIWCWNDFLHCYNLIPCIFIPHCASLTKQEAVWSSVTGLILIGIKSNQNEKKYN